MWGKQRLRSEDGFTIVEALVLAAIVAVMISGFASYQFNRNKALQAQETRAQYGQLGLNLRNTINQTEALISSEEVMGNPYLAGAIEDTPGGPGGGPIEPINDPEPDPTPNVCPVNCSFVESTGQCQFDSAIASICTSGSVISSGGGNTEICPAGCSAPVSTLQQSGQGGTPNG